MAQAPTEPPKSEPATPAVPITPPAASAPAPAPTAAATPPAAPKPATPTPAEEPSMLAALADHPMAVPGGIGLVVLLAGLALYRLRGRFRKDNGETSFLESRLQPDSFFGASGGQRVDTRDATGVSSSMSYSLSQLDAIGDVDPVAEADVYLAYGRDLQAEEILKEAMRGNPDRLAIRTKLLEVYAKRRDTKGFEMLATQLYALTKGEGDDWAKAQELGRGIDPENPLYKPGGAPVAAVAGDGGRMIEPLGASTMPQSIMPHTSGFPASAIDSMPAPDSRSAAPDLDLDLDLGTMPKPSARRDAQPSQPPMDLESISLDLNPSASMPLSSGAQAASGAKPSLDFGDFTLPAQPSGTRHVRRQRPARAQARAGRGVPPDRRHGRRTRPARRGRRQGRWGAEDQSAEHARQPRVMGPLPKRPERPPRPLEGDTSGPAKPDPRCPLGNGLVADRPVAGPWASATAAPRYKGWQSQPDGQTIQDHLERALSTFADTRVSTVCAGRTDAGVHGLNQVVHFDAPVERDAFSWVRGTNRYLPPTSLCSGVRRFRSTSTHASRRAARRYRYVLLRSPVRPSIETGLVGWVFDELALEPMREAARHLIGEHDFSSFRSSECQAKSPVKTLRSIAIEQRGAYWHFDFDASAFLHHMVRNIMGCLLAVGSARRPAGVDARGAGCSPPRRCGADVCRRRPLLRRPVLRCRSAAARPCTGERLVALRHPLQQRTRIKICGLSQEADVAAAVEAGADAVGFVLYAKSPRHVSAARAGELARALPPFVTPVCLFVNAKPDDIHRALDHVPRRGAAVSRRRDTCAVRGATPQLHPRCAHDREPCRW